MIHFKYCILALLLVSGIGCGAPEQFDDDIGQVEQASTIQVAVGGAGSKLTSGSALAGSGGFVFYASACIIPMPSDGVCAVPPANKTLRVRADTAELQSTRTEIVNALNASAQLGGFAWTIVNDDGGTNNLFLTNGNFYGNANTAQFDTNRYLTKDVQVGPVLTEGSPLAGTFKAITGVIVGINVERLRSDCHNAFPAVPADESACFFEGRRHLVAQSIYIMLGIGTDIVGIGTTVTNIRNFYSSRDMSPLLTVKTLLSSGQRCRTRAFSGIGVSLLTSNAQSCAND